MNSVAWHSAEINLCQTQGDVLAIFDCCNAGQLCQYRGRIRFEYLGACAARQTTPGPGENSFTAALIWALRDLCRPNFSFPTSELQQKITEAPNWSKGQVPPLGHRLTPSLDHIRIAPLGYEPSPALDSNDEPPSTFEFLDLRFHFPETLTNDHVIQVAEELSSWLSEKKTKTKAITFVSKQSGEMLTPIPSSFAFGEVARELFFKQKFARRWISGRREGPHVEPCPANTTDNTVEVGHLSTPPALQTTDQPVSQESQQNDSYAETPPTDLLALSSHEGKPTSSLENEIMTSTGSQSSITANYHRTRDPSPRSTATTTTTIDQKVKRIHPEKPAAMYGTPEPSSDSQTPLTSRPTNPCPSSKLRRTTRKRVNTENLDRAACAKKKRS
jgi:hypothetical protein